MIVKEVGKIQWMLFLRNSDLRDYILKLRHILQHLPRKLWDRQVSYYDRRAWFGSLLGLWSWWFFSPAKSKVVDRIVHKFFIDNRWRKINLNVLANDWELDVTDKVKLSFLVFEVDVVLHLRNNIVSALYFFYLYFRSKLWFKSLANSFQWALFSPLLFDHS